jgi:hypothetical protein
MGFGFIPKNIKIPVLDPFFGLFLLGGRRGLKIISGVGSILNLISTFHNIVWYVLKLFSN